MRSGTASLFLFQCIQPPIVIYKVLDELCGALILQFIGSNTSTGQQLTQCWVNSSFIKLVLVLVPAEM